MGAPEKRSDVKHCFDLSSMNQCTFIDKVLIQRHLQVLYMIKESLIPQEEA